MWAAFRALLHCVTHEENGGALSSNLPCLSWVLFPVSLSHLLILLALCVFLPHIIENFLSLLLDSPLQNHTKEQGLPP